MGEVIRFEPRTTVSGHRQDRERAQAELRGFTLSELRTLWDTADDGLQSDGYWIEDIHAELNRRGDGRYCAV